MAQISFITLSPVDGRKSFYEKAKARQWQDTDGMHAVLTSYGTDVLRIDNGELTRLWSGYSVTTMRHIRSFLNLYSYQTMTAKEWRALPVEN